MRVRPEAEAFTRACRAWESAGEPQSGPMLDRLNQAREDFLAACRPDPPEDNTGEEVISMGPKIGPGPGPQ